MNTITGEYEEEELTDEELDDIYQENLYWAAVNNAWVAAGEKCRVCDTPISLSDFEQNYCPKCSVEEIPF